MSAPAPESHGGASHYKYGTGKSQERKGLDGRLREKTGEFRAKRSNTRATDISVFPKNRPDATLGAPRKSGGKKRKAPDMKAWAERVLVRLKAHYGKRVTPDSSALFEDVRSDKS
jgi:hypothetical protein